MGKRVRISNDSLNSYGTRVLTAGMDVEQYGRNPVLLYMHERGSVIGYMKDLAVDGGEVTGEPVFDEASELSVRCKRQWEFGSLKMVSAGLDILETSEDPALLVQGQTCPTITRSKLFEVSLVDVGANDDAIVLRRGGRQVTLGGDSPCPLPLLTTLNNIKKEKKMEQKEIAIRLGLPETATEAEITALIGELKAAREENASLLKEKETLVLAGVNGLVDRAVEERRVSPDKKGEFVELGREIGVDRLRSLLASMQPRLKVSAVIGRHGSARAEGSPGRLGEVPADELLALRRDNPAEYARLYRAEYGMDCPALED